MQSSVHLEGVYAGWMAPPSVLVEVAGLVAEQTARDDPSEHAGGVGLLTRTEVQVLASWKSRKGPGQREVRGTAEEVAAAMAAASPIQAEIAGYGQRGMILVRWSSWRGCEVIVRGDPKWSDEALQLLDEALRPYHRWWGHLGSLGRLAAAAVAVILATLVAGPLSEPETTPLSYAPLAVALIVGLPPLIARDTWPAPFEFAEPGRARAPRRAWSLLAWYGLGLVALLAWAVLLLGG